MGKKVSVNRQGNVAVLRLENPPRNFLGPLVRAHISEALQELEADETVQGIILAGAGDVFSGGHNPVRHDLRAGTMSLAQLCQKIEDCQKPVVACLHGNAYGAGCELALAAHARVALAGTKIGLTDITLGLPPQAGASQRLPRMAGAQTALTVMLSGEQLDVSDPLLDNVIDHIAEADVVSAAVAHLETLLASGHRPVASRDRTDGFADPLAYQAAIKDCRATLGQGALLPQRVILQLVESAQLLPFSAGQALELDLCEECLNSDVAQGHLHLLLAQRRVMNLPEAKRASAQPVSCLGVVGSGPAGVALVLAALETGLPTIWFERSEAEANAAKSRFEKALEVEKASSDQWYSLMKNLTITHDRQALAQADMVIETVAETAKSKQQVISVLAKIVPAATILVTHSASLSVDQVAEASERPSQVVGLHVLPAPVRARLAEYIPGERTSDGAVVSLHALLQRLRISAVRCGSHGGTIGARMMAACRDAADYALDLGATPAQVDAALVQHGKANGIFVPLDMLGLKAELARAAQRHQQDHYPARHLARMENLVQRGRTGRAASAGFYQWNGNTPSPHPEDTQPADAPDNDLIWHLCLGAMANEGARLLRAGIALRPSDIDLIMVRNHGFPAWSGGVMNAADQMGLFTLQRALKPHADAAPRLFATDPGIADLIKNGENFEVLNGVGGKRRLIAG